MSATAKKATGRCAAEPRTFSEPNPYVPGRCAAELEGALPEAIAACTALVRVCRDAPGDLARLKAAAHRASVAAGLVAGFAHMSRG